jgi:hypothetical protein
MFCNKNSLVRCAIDLKWKMQDAGIGGSIDLWMWAWCTNWCMVRCAIDLKWKMRDAGIGGCYQSLDVSVKHKLKKKQCGALIFQFPFVAASVESILHCCAAISPFYQIISSICLICPCWWLPLFETVNKMQSITISAWMHILKFGHTVQY